MKGKRLQAGVVSPRLAATAAMLALFGAGSGAFAQETRPGLSPERCEADRAACAASLGVDPAHLTFAELGGVLRDATGAPLAGVPVGVFWNLDGVEPGCRRVVEALMPRARPRSSDDGSYRVLVPNCGTIRYTLVPDDPAFEWDPAQYHVTVGDGRAQGAQPAEKEDAATKARAPAPYTPALRPSPRAETMPEGATRAEQGSGETAVDGRDLAALSADEGNGADPAGGRPRPGYAGLQRDANSALWRATTGCDAPGNALAGPTPEELAACADKPAGQRKAASDRGRDDFNALFGLGGTTSAGLGKRAAADRGLPTLTLDEDGNPVLPSVAETEAYLRGLVASLSTDPEERGSGDAAGDTNGEGKGLTEGEARSLFRDGVVWLTQAVGSVLGLGGPAGKAAGAGVKQAGKMAAEEAEKLANPGMAYRFGGDHYRKALEASESDERRPDPSEVPTQVYSEAECRAICGGTSSSLAQREACGCDDPSQGIKNPSGTETGAGTRDLSTVDGMSKAREKTDPLIHTTGEEPDPEPVRIDQLPERGGKGPNPDPVTGSGGNQ